MRFIRNCSMLLAGIGGVCTVLMMVQIVADVLSRWMFGVPLSGTMEIVSIYYLVPLTFLPLAAIEFADRHIAVDMFVLLLPAAARRPLALAMSVLAFGFTGWLTWVSFEEAFGAYQIGEVIETAASVMIIWPSRFILAIGILVMVVVIGIQLVLQVQQIISGRPHQPDETKS